MRYLLLIHSEEKRWEAATSADQGDMLAAYQKYSSELRSAGVMVGGDALVPSSDGCRVQVRAGKRSVMDGPFMETKEVIGGYYLIECASKEEAAAWAAKCPGASYGTMEVRAIMDVPH